MHLAVAAPGGGAPDEAGGLGEGGVEREGLIALARGRVREAVHVGWGERGAALGAVDLGPEFGG